MDLIVHLFLLGWFYGKGMTVFDKTFGETLSKACSMSRNMHREASQALMYRLTSVWPFRITSWVDLFFLKPNWRFGRRLLALLLNRSAISLYNIFLTQSRSMILDCLVVKPVLDV